MKAVTTPLKTSRDHWGCRPRHTGKSHALCRVQCRLGQHGIPWPSRAVCVLALPGDGSPPSPGGGSWGSQPPVALPSESCSALRSLVLSDRMLTLAVEARVFPRLCWCLCAGVSALTLICAGAGQEAAQPFARLCSGAAMGARAGGSMSVRAGGNYSLVFPWGVWRGVESRQSSPSTYQSTPGSECERSREPVGHQSSLGRRKAEGESLL